CGPLPPARVIDLLTQVCTSLIEAHGAGMIHRDIKPGNLLIRADGQVKIMDLGLVKIRNAPKSMAVTRTGQVLGTPYYMPPEQFGGNGQLDSRADIYALGATLYHLVAGKPPFEGDGVLALVEKHRREPVSWSDQCRKAVPPWLRGVIERCLAKRPADRFPSAAAVAQALQTGDDRSISMTLRANRAAARTQDNSLRPRGIVVAAFRNLSGSPADDWIGEALAEYLTNRLMELEGVHVADRQSLLKMLVRGDRPEGGTESDRPVDAEQLLDAARLVGAHLVIAGGFQRSGSALRITIHALSAVADGPNPLGSFSGTTADLFGLEDRIAAKVVAFVGHRFRPEQGRGGGTENVEAHEAYMRGRRSFADADYHKAIELSEQALAMDPDYVEPLGLLGACFARLGEYDRAVEYHQRQEHQARESQDSPRLAEALGNLGVMYYYKGEYQLAFEFLDQARTLRAELNLTSDTAKYQGNLGFVLMRLERYDEAEAAFAEAIEISKENGDLVSLTWPYNGLGGVLLKQHRYPEAREYYRRALALADEIGDRVNVG
ncbi:MAG: tetratricopeptide repeat protein, partial [bacterium]|nr:tetratricopeptide repeat protein [bacterium]